LFLIGFRIASIALAAASSVLFAPVKVNIAPLRTLELAATNARREQDNDVRVNLGASQRVEHSLDLGSREDRHFAIFGFQAVKSGLQDSSARVPARPHPRAPYATRGVRALPCERLGQCHRAGLHVAKCCAMSEMRGAKLLKIQRSNMGNYLSINELTVALCRFGRD
jgi:hypothetical protein